jgi:outer membrane protein OmpA-like peptidoglycan-associated protein
MMFARTALCGVLLVSLTIIGEAATAEDMTKEQIIRSLQVPTRGLSDSGANSGMTSISPNAPSAVVDSPPSSPASASSTSDLVDRLRVIQNRQISVEERSQIADWMKHEALPTIDIEVFFPYNSAVITPEALPKLIMLGQALSDPRLMGSAFLIGGHTDAKGSDGYNIALSSHRAEVVKRFLVQNFHIEPNTLYAMGFGQEQLKKPDDPFAAENRRVEIINLALTGVSRR